MPHSVQVQTANLPSGVVSVHLPNGVNALNGQVINLTDEEFGLLAPTAFLSQNPSTGYLKDLGEIGVGGSIAGGVGAGSLALSTTSTTVAGTAGTYIASQPFNGAAYKKAVISLSAYNNTATSTVTFTNLPGGVAFSAAPAVTVVNTTGVLGTVTATTTTLTLPVPTTGPVTGWVFAEGF